MLTNVDYVDYAAVLENPYQEASRIAQFVGHDFDLAAMIRQVEPSLHREKAACRASLQGVSDELQGQTFGTEGDREPQGF